MNEFLMKNSGLLCKDPIPYDYRQEWQKQGLVMGSQFEREPINRWHEAKRLRNQNKKRKEWWDE